MPGLGSGRFKWTVYGLLVLNTYLFLRTEETMTAFLDSAAWVLSLGLMEYESRSLGETYSGPVEKALLVVLNVFAYSVIIYAWYGYIVERDWVDVVKASAWLGVCAILLYQMYAPGDYDDAEYRLVNGVQAAL